MLSFGGLETFLLLMVLILAIFGCSLINCTDWKEYGASGESLIGYLHQRFIWKMRLAIEAVINNSSNAQYMWFYTY